MKKKAGPRLQSVCEHLLFCYFQSSSSVDPMSFYNFSHDEPRLNHFEFDVETKKIPHPDKNNCYLNPTQKPQDLLEYLVTHFSKDNDLILDLCSGTGFIFLKQI